MLEHSPSERESLLMELARLERAEQALSKVRRRLHDQLDRGFSSPSAAAKERQVSDERRSLHDQIDALEAHIASLLPSA
jgi:hypothetical protein